MCAPLLISVGRSLCGQCLADALAGTDHLVRLLVAGGVVTVITEAGALEELGKLPRLLVGEYNLDLDLFHTSVLRWMGARPSCPPIPRRTLQEGSSWLNGAIRGYAEPQRAEGGGEER